MKLGPQRPSQPAIIAQDSDRALCSLSAVVTNRIEERGGGQPGEVLLLPLPPGAFGDLRSVGAAPNDLGHAVAEAAADGLQRFDAALVLDGVVQQAGDGLVLVAAALETSAATDSRCARYGSPPTFRRCPECSPAA